MKNILFIIPSSYFIRTRLNSLKNLIFHCYFELGAGILILSYVQGLTVSQSLVAFVIGYLAFISIYEIGYITNDQFSEKLEKAPRQRREVDLSWAYPLLWILVRIGIFLFITSSYKFATSLEWWIFYLALAASFFLHNIISVTDFRLISFINLSVFRFLAPIFPFISSESIKLIFPVVLLHYSFFRTLIYMDSKDLLNVAARKTPLFNVLFYLITLLISILYSVLVESMTPLILSSYFLVFVILYYITSYRSSKRI